MIYTLVGILLILWLIGLIAHVLGGLIYILLLLAVVLFLYDRLTGHHKPPQ